MFITALANIFHRFVRHFQHLATLAVITSLSTVATAQTAPSEIFVFNGGQFFYGWSSKDMNPGNVASYGWVMTQLGLLDATGKPPEWADDNTLRQGNVVVGRAIVCQVTEHITQLCGFESLDGTKRAYDLNSLPESTSTDRATFLRAWNEVGENGTIVIVKHGWENRDDQGNVTERGGAVALDNGVMYDGFREASDTESPGTNISINGPYPISGRPGANIHIELHTCYGACDWDGADPGTSVLETLENIPGVGSAEGETDKVIIKRDLYYTNNPSENQIKVFYRALGPLAAKAGFRNREGKPNIGVYLNSLSYLSMFVVLDWAAAQAGIEYRIEYSMVDDPTHSVRFELVAPGVGNSGGLLFDAVPDVDGPEILVTQLQVPEGALSMKTPVQIVSGAIDPTAIPEGLAPVSPAVTVSRYGVDDMLEFAIPSELMLEYPVFGPDPVGLFRLESDGTLVQVSDAWIDSTVDVAGASITGNGTWVLLGEAIEDRPADFNLDRQVNIDDFLELVDAWGECDIPWCQHDLDGNGDVGIDDLMAVLDQWGSDFM